MFIYMSIAVLKGNGRAEENYICVVTYIIHELLRISCIDMLGYFQADSYVELALKIEV